MEKILNFFKNKKHLVMYLVGVLLLSTGVSYAYFVGQTESIGEGSIASAKTANIISEGMIADGNINVNEIDIYPGHKTIASLKVTALGSDVPMIYSVLFEGSNTFETEIKYKVYKVESNIEASYSCTKEREAQDGALIYYEECSGINIDQLGDVVAEGTINKGEGTTELLNEEIILATEAGTEVYYYIEIEYPNLDDNQNNDIGSSLSGKINIERSSRIYSSPRITFVANTTSGNNNWYTSANIITSISTETGEYDVLYCTTTSSSCEANVTPSISNNQFTTTLSSNASAQRICVRVVDEYNQVTEGCSSAYSVDNTSPTVTISSTSVTDSTISVTVSGSDSHSGIYQYQFSSNGGSSYTTVTTTSSTYTYTFTNLSSNTSYSIRVRAVDKAGNTSSVASRSVTTDSATAADTIIADNTVKTNPTLTATSCSSGCGVSENGLYQGEDDYGTTYYFRGTVDNNWVSFAGYYWRIIRINGDGTIRLIYNGTTTDATGSGTQLDEESAFNSSSYVYQYSYSVGYMYTASTRASIGQHGTTTDSTIKEAIDDWYEENLFNTDYEDYLADSGFCGDRNLSSSTSSWVASGSSVYYAAYDRQQNGTPTFECTNTSDLYTTSSSSTGNKALTYAIGLITMDEVRYAGAYSATSNTGYWLHTEEDFWSMSPSYYSGSYTFMFRAGSDGRLSSSIGANIKSGVRPVINLKAGTLFTGSGTASDPYKVV